MKAVYQLALALVFFTVACREGKKAVADKSHGPADTFYLCDKLVALDSITRDEYERVPVIPIGDSLEEVNLLHDSTAVKRHGDSLIIVAGGKEIILINNHSDTSDATANHQYLGFNKDLGKYIVQSVYWEWYNYILIDKESGDTVVTCGEPIASPDKKFFICGNADLVAQFTFNGFELYENQHKPNLICQRGLQKWGPQEIKWIAQNTLLVKASVADTTFPNLERSGHYKLSIK